MIFFGGTSNPLLAQGVAKALGIKLGSIEITRFIDNECRVYVKEEVAETSTVVLQSLSQIADQNLVELCLIAQALKDLGAHDATAVVPWLGYSKQDKAFRKGEAVSAHLVAKVIEVAGFDRIITVELHSENVIPYFHIPVIELSTHGLFAELLRPKVAQNNILVASPDRGGKSRSERFATTVGLPIVYLEKERNKETGAVTVKSVSSDVSGREVIIFDDIINTGATAIQTSKFLKVHGVKRILFLATHAILAGDASRRLAESTIDEVIVTDTVAIPKEKQFNKLQVISVAPLLAEAIAQIRQ